MDEQADDERRQPERESRGDAELAVDLEVPTEEADKVTGGVIAPCDRAKQ